MSNVIFMKSAGGGYNSFIDGKVVFADKYFKIPGECFVKDCNIVYDKEKYGFVKGEVLSGVAADMVKFVRENSMDYNEIYSMVFDGTEGIFGKVKGEKKFDCYVGGKFFCQVTNSSMYEWVVANGRLVEIPVNDILYWSKGRGVSDNQVMCFLAKRIGYETKSYRVWKNAVVCFEDCHEWFNLYKGSSHRVDERVDIDRLLEELGEPDRIISRGDVIRFARENFIAFHGYCPIGKKLTKEKFHFLNSSYLLEMYSAANVSDIDLFNVRLHKDAEASWTGLLNWLSDMSRYATGKNVAEYAKVRRQIKSVVGYLD